MSWVGRPTAVRIKSIVTRPALGILAAPTLARVAVRLDKETAKSITFSKYSTHYHILHNPTLYTTPQTPTYMKSLHCTATEEDSYSQWHLYKE